MQGGKWWNKCSHGRDQRCSHPARWEKSCTGCSKENGADLKVILRKSAASFSSAALRPRPDGKRYSWVAKSDGNFRPGTNPTGGSFAKTCPCSPQHVCQKTLAAALAAAVPVHQRPWGQKWPGAAGRTTSTPCHMRHEHCRAGTSEEKGFPLLSSCSRRLAE